MFNLMFPFSLRSFLHHLLSALTSCFIAFEAWIKRSACVHILSQFARATNCFPTFTHLLSVFKTLTVLYFSFPRWSTLMTAKGSGHLRNKIFIAQHFSTSCAKCIAAIASGCVPHRPFKPSITMLAHCCLKIGYSLPPQVFMESGSSPHYHV